MGKKKNKKPQKASWDVVYQEKYAEMRWYRDYELRISSSVITILLALVAASTSDWFDSVIAAIILSVIALTLTLSGILSVYHASQRFQQHSKIFFEILELEPKKYREAWQAIETADSRRAIIMKIARGRVLIIVVQIVLFLAIIGLLWLV